MKKIVDKLLAVIQKIPPSVNSPLPNNKYAEFAVEPYFENFKTEENYQNIALELWRIIEDIEKAEALTKGDNPALRSLITSLTEKRHLYMSMKEVEVLVKEKIEQINEEKK